MNDKSKHRQFQQKIIYFADWNPNQLTGDILPLSKVGISANPKERITEYTVPPFQPTITATFIPQEDARKVERELHNYFKLHDFHINGEWFSLPDSIIGWAERQNKVSKSDIQNIDVKNC